MTTSEELTPDVRIACVICHKAKPLDDMQLRRGDGWICWNCWNDAVAK